MMKQNILYIDVGNTDIVCDDGVSVSRFSGADGVAFLGTYQNITHIVFSSVVAHISDQIKDYAAQNNIECHHIHHHSQIGFVMDVNMPETVGLDRLVGLAGARKDYDGALLVVDSGSAVTFDVLSGDNHFQGGAIGAGMMMQRDGLADYTDALPRVTLAGDISVIGKQTDAALQSGIYWGHIAQIEGMILRIKQAYPEALTVIGTGGIMNLCAKDIKYIDYFAPNLILSGLKAIFQNKIF